MSRKIKFIATENLRIKREERFKQEEMAELIAMQIPGKTYSRSYYGHIETGIKTCSAQVAIAIARILDCSIDNIFTTKEEIINE